MMNEYRKLMEDIPVPAGLDERVLWAARRQAAERPGRRAERPSRTWARAAVCAVCALALVLGSVTLRPAPAVERKPAAGGTEGQMAEVPALSFGLTAYAAMTGETYAPGADGSIAFAVGEGCTTLEFGSFTGCLFQIDGEDIAEVALSIDRGGLYRYQCRDGLTEEQMAEYRQAMAEGRLAPAAISRRDDGTWYMPEMTALGESVRESYDPEARYGFWVSPEEMAYDTGLGMTAEAQMDADLFDGGALKVTVIWSDGTERTQTYRLHSGMLKVEPTENGELAVLPEPVAPDDRETPWVYGICAALEQ